MRLPLLFFLVVTLVPNLSVSQNWNEILEINDSKTKQDGQFGYTVALDGEYAVVGSNGGGTGTVLVFKKQENGEWSQIQELKPSDGKTLDQFGSSVSINKDIIVVGALWADIKKGETVFKDAGAAYIFQKENEVWNEKQKLIASDPFDEDQFGISVDVDGDHIMVGALWNDYDENGKKRRVDAGAVYVFENSGSSWIQKQKLVSNDRKDYDLFGVSVSMEKNTAVIGAYRSGFDEDNKNYMEFAGSAYLFQKNSEGLWSQKEKIVPKERRAGSFFGYSVSLGGDLLIIGSQEHDLDMHGGSELQGAGAAYIFKKEGDEWKEKQKITAMDRQQNAYFGESVYTDGKKCIVGAWGQKLDENGQNVLDTAGAAYIFEDSGNGNWAEKIKITPKNRSVGDQFGISVALEGDYALVGAWGKDTKEQSWVGSAFLFSNCKKPEIKISTSGELIMRGEDVIIGAEGADNFSWDKGVKNNISFKPEKTDKYRVIGRNKTGCYSEAEIEIFVKENVIDALALRKANPKQEFTALPNSDYRIIPLANNKTLAASTQEIIQDFSGLTILSNLKYNESGNPAADINVLLLDENGLIIKRGVTNSKGEAKFEMLDPEKSYDVVIDKNDPKLETSVLKSGKELVMKKKELIQMIGGYALLSHIEYNESSEPASDIYVLLLDEDGFILKKGKTNQDGIAIFEELDREKSYQVIIDKNHPSLNVDVKLKGQVIAVDTKRIIENFKRLTILSKLSYTESDAPAADVYVMLIDENNNVIKKGKTNNDGMAMFLMSNDNKKYTIVIDREMMINSGEIKVSETYEFKNIYFDFNSDVIRMEAKEVLNELATFLNKERNKKLMIHAHTDAVGTDLANKTLAERRGYNVKNYLVSKGVKADQVEVDPIGDAQPIADNSKDIGRQLNRRVEFELFNP